MRVELRQFMSADIDDLEAFDPPLGSAWSIQADVTVAPIGYLPGGDIFQFEICSEAWVAERLNAGPLFADRRLVVRRYDYAEVRTAVEKAIDGAARGAATWDEFARSLNLQMAWEFEGYRP